MSIRDTKERIESLDAEGYVRTESEGFPPTVLTNSGLQAFALNHTRLLTAIKKYLEPQANEAQSEMVYNELMEAIKEAEE